MDPERDLYGEDDEKLVSRSGLHNLERQTDDKTAGKKERTPEDALLEGIQSAADKQGGLFHEEGGEEKRLGPIRAGVAYGALRGVVKMNRRKKAAGGAAVVLVGLFVAIFIIASGPGQLVQLATLLEKSFKNSQNESFKVSNSLLNYAGEEDPGLSRAGLLGRTFLKPALAKLNDIGITIEANAGAGLNGASIDADTLASKYSELNGMSPEETKSWIAEHFGVDESVISQAKDGSNKYKIDSKGFSLSDDQKLMKSVIGEIGNTSLTDSLKDGDLISAINLRFFSDYLNVSSMFHPFERLSQEAQKKLANRAAAKQAEEEEQQTEAEPTESEANGAVTSVEEDDSSLGNPLSSGLLVAGTACAMRSIGELVPIINRDRVVFPALIVGVGFEAEGDQIKTNQDVSLAQVGGSVDSLTDSKGQSIWQSGDIQQAEGLERTGSELSANTDMAQAFEGTSGAAIVKWADDAASATTGGILPASIVCSKGGQALQVVLSVGFAAGDVFSEGALTPAILGVLAKQADGFLVSAIAMHFVKNFVLSKTTATLAKDAFSGPLGGSLIKAGADSAAQFLEATQGGSVASPGVASAIALEQQQEDNQQFASESIFSRLFDINDYRSVAGKLADSFSANVSLDFASLTRSFGNLGSSLISNLSSIFLPKSHAADTYKNVVSPFAIPPAIIDNPALADPYKNDNVVSNELTAQCGPSAGTTSVDNQTVINCPTITRAMICYGVDIYQNSSSGEPLWDVTPKTLPDPTSDEYKSQNCGATDLGWARIVMFIKSTRTMNAIACANGDDQGCTDEDYKAAANSNPGTSTTGSSSCSGAASNTSYFNTVGKNICASNGQTFTPYGISIVDDLEGPRWCDPHNETAADAQIQAAGQTSWHANNIRLQVSEDHFVSGNNCVSGGKTYTAQDAMTRLGQEVSEIEQMGKVPIINDDTEQTGGSTAPTQTTIDFWNKVTAYFGSNNTNNQYGNIIFDIFNEPNTTGSVWANGGSEYGKTFLGMQDIINSIRNGTNLNENLIFAEGSQGGPPIYIRSSLNVLSDYHLTGTNLVYDYHHVNLNDSESAWKDTMGLNSGINAPIVDGEWTQYASPRPYECFVNGPNNISTYFNLMQQNNIGMIFWSLEPGVGTINGSTTYPVSDIITSSFPETASGYSTPSSFSGAYKCAYDSNGNLTGQGAGTQVQNYFAQYSKAPGQ